MSDPPETHYTLPLDFAAALGQAVASFGWLEEVMKRALYSLDRARLAGDLSEEELQRWLRHMDDLADDSMGTLVEQLDAALRRHPGLPDRIPLNDRLVALKIQRNLLCHASWRPAGAGRWHPAFVNAKGEPYGTDFSVEDLLATRDETVALGRKIVSIMHATGIPGQWAGDDV
ncbi:hypothetical protein [Paracoccus aminophilus]|uniref:hypothetical protein n=1 Tax=Paracoccus aminophilus TaxID=34003 RepID=UPI000423B11D|nr:hypothetical protein [Paracoccus aminophilus]